MRAADHRRHRARTRIRLGTGDVAAAYTDVLVGVGRVGEKGGWVWSGDLVTAAALLCPLRTAHVEAQCVTDELAGQLTGRNAPHAAACVLWDSGISA